MKQLKPLIYLHIPKNAGTSIQSMMIDKGEFWSGPFEECYKAHRLIISSAKEWDYWVDNVEDKSFNEIIKIHLHMEPYEYAISPITDLCKNKKYNDFNWMTILRNPVERVISEYYFFDEWWHNRPVKKDKAWGDEDLWVRSASNICGHLSEETRSSIASYNESENTHNTQVKYLIGKGYLNDYVVTEEDCDALIDSMERLNFKVGVVEELADSINLFNESFGFGFGQMPLLNKNASKLPVDEHTKEQILKNNKWDTKLHAYYLNKFKT